MNSHSIIQIQVGDKAPDFTLPTHNEGELNLHWYQTRKKVVLAFYPGDWTPVCANQIPAYENILDEFDKLNTQLLAISCDSIACHIAWAKSIGGISFPLMSDFHPHGKVCQQYGVLSSRGYAERVIVVIDSKGIIRHIDNVGFSILPDNEKLLKEIALLD